MATIANTSDISVTAQHVYPKATTRLTDPSGDSLEIIEVEDPLMPWSSSSRNILKFIKSRKGKHRKESIEEITTFQDIDINDDGIDRDLDNPGFVDKPPYMAYLRVLKTVCLFVSFFALGAFTALFGPSLFDLAYRTGSSIHEMSFVFTSRSIGYLIGSVVGGWLYDKYDSYLVLGGICLAAAVFMVAFPLVTNIYALVAIGCISSAMGGALDTDGNALILVLWPGSGPIMQFLHFTFALGSFVAPLLAKPFLLPEAVTNPTAAPTPANLSLNITSLDPTYELETNTTSYIYNVVPITWAYLIGAVPFVVSGVVFLAFSCIKSCKEPYVKKPEHLVATSGQGGTVYKAVILTLFFLLLLQYVGMETVYGGFVFAFAVKAKPSMTKDNAALLNGGYWGSFALGRLAAVPTSKYLKPNHMIICALVGTVIAGAVLVSQSVEGCYVASSVRLWSGTVLLGVAASSVFPAALSWTECFIDVTGRTASILLVGSCLGDMVVPVAVGTTLDTVGPCTLMYSILGLSILCVINFLGITLFARYYTSFGISSGFEFHNRSKNDFNEPPKPQTQPDNDMLELLDNQLA